MNHFNGLTPAEAERLAVLAEEATEIAQAAMKILRHGYESHNPHVNSLTNRCHLEKEIGQLQNAYNMMYVAGDLNYEKVLRAQVEKSQTIGQWLHHQETPK